MVVITKEFLAGVKTEGLVSMVKQHIISEWGAEQVTPHESELMNIS